MISMQTRREIRRYCKSTAVDHLEQRLALQETIKTHAENGMVQIAISGVGCDGMEYWGQKVLVKASTALVEQEFRRISYNADGPTHMEIVSPSLMVERGSYDRINK